MRQAPELADGAKNFSQADGEVRLVRRASSGGLIEIVTLVHLHSQLLVGYLALVVGLTFGLYAVGTSAAVKIRLKVLLGLILAQSLIGVVQYFTDVPEVLVIMHVAGAGLCTAATAAVWAAGQTRAR